MATVFEAVPFRQPATRHPVGRIVRAYRQATTAAAGLTQFAVINDKIKFFRQAMNSMITRVEVTTTDIDTNATPTAAVRVRLTDGSTNKDFLTANTIPQTGGIARPSTAAECANLGFVPTNDNFWWEVELTTAAATGADGSVMLIVESIMALEHGLAT